MVASLEPDRCEGCGQSAGQANYCPVDETTHSHGCIHTVSGLMWLCADCARVESIIPAGASIKP